MDSAKIAIFVDWENLRSDLQNVQHNYKVFKQFNFNRLPHFDAFIKTFIQSDERLYRTFLYVSEPFSENKIVKNSKLEADFEEYKSFYTSGKHEELKKPINHYEAITNKSEAIKAFKHTMVGLEYSTIRQGIVKMKPLSYVKEDVWVRGVQNNAPTIWVPKLELQQKQVDVLLALDIAKVCYEGFVDRILLFCKDTDLAPILDFARTKHLQVFVAHIEESMDLVADELKAASDAVRVRSIQDILDNIKDDMEMGVKKPTTYPLNRGKPFHGIDIAKSEGNSF
ncbi:NYN domain-containing protein [Helicobacter mehlei]|uniref:NYN domain-containing protein n=1 Tax=Helicobacter mehlei TaxID=2316080 RepID=A0A553UQL8_9HELI|nr:NYN domain-containing protein [Helicobacter mehlei]TSA82504.1 NYN domain-containing protein [Helicobacter mehlei]